MDRERLVEAPKVAWAGIAAFAVVVVLELCAHFAFGESASERNAFGYDRQTSFVREGKDVVIEPAASRRFWPQRYAATKPPGTRRIVVVGDSVARGGALDDSVAWQLGIRLASSCGLASEVWNLSSPGYGSGRKAVVVDKALDYAPDLVVYHAAVTTEYEDSRERTRYEEYHSWHPRHWFDQLPFIGRLKLSKVERMYWSWLPEEVRAAQTDDPLEARIRALASKSDVAAWLPGMLANFDRTVARVRSAGVPLLILVQTQWDPATGRLDDLGLDAVLAARYGAMRGVTVISSRRLFESAANRAELFYDKSHWTSAGNDAVAAALGPAVVRAFGLLNECSPPPAAPPAAAAARLAGMNP